MRLLLVDDHEVVRQGLRALLERRPGVHVVAEAGSAAEAVEEARRTDPDVVVMDVRLPDRSGVEACREIRDANPNIKVIMLTAFPDDQAVVDSILAGANGYLLKQVRARDLIAAIERVYQGESLLDPAVTRTVLERMRALAARPGHAGSGLSEQEEKVLSLIALGKTNREIAQDLFLSEKTVKNYVSNILDKLNLRRRTEAAAYWVRQGQQRGG